MTWYRPWLVSLASLGGLGAGPPGPVLEGVVLGPGGRPVAAALVVATPVKAPGEARSTRADSEGRFRQPVATNETHRVWAQAPGLALARLDEARPGVPITITLAKGGVIEGTVRDGTEGGPVAGARVEAAPQDDRLRVWLPWEPTAGRVAAVTDARGRYRLEGLAPGLHEISATARGFGIRRKPNARLGAPVDLVLSPGAWISGRVVGPEGRPLPGASVRAEAENGDWPTPPTAVITGADGGFTLAGLGHGAYRVVARHPGLAPGFASGVLAERGAAATAELRLSPGATVTGRLIGAAGRPVGGRVRVLEVDGWPAPWSVGDALKTEAGSDGRFVLEHVPSARVVLGVVAPGHAGQRVEVELGPRTPLSDVGDVVLEVGPTIRGRVRDASGAPISDAIVHAYLATPRPDPPSVVEDARSDSEGRFLLVGVEAGLPYALSASAPGFAPARDRVEAPAEDVDLVLARGGALQGAVADAQGRPLGSFRIEARMTAPHAPGEGTYGPKTSPDGRFSLEGLAEGTYALKVTAAGLAPATVSGVTVKAGAATDVGTLRLGRGGVVRGVVVDAADRPVAGATVSASTPGSADHRPWDPASSVETDLSGAFEIQGVPAGPVELATRHPEFAPGRASTIVVETDREPVVARIVLTRGGRIEGRARTRNGSPVAAAYVQVSPRPSGHATSVPVAADGSFTVEHVPPGAAWLNLMGRTGPGRMATMAETDVVTREGETTTVDLLVRDILVSGAVTRGGSPVPGVRVALSRTGASFAMAPPPGHRPAAPSGVPRESAVTREDGRYELITGEPGRTSVSVESLDGRTRYLQRSVIVPDADALALDLELGGAALAGVVVDEETGEPLADASVHAGAVRSHDPSAETRTSSDGRFHFELPAGEYDLLARREGYASGSLRATTGAGDLRLELARGHVIAGRIVDASGRGVGNLAVHAQRPNGFGGGGPTLLDGSFRFTDLAAGTYRVMAGSPTLGYARQDGVATGETDLVLTLQPAGQVQLSVADEGGTPLSGVQCRVVSVDGAPVPGPALEAVTTDAQGVAELVAPPGQVKVMIQKAGWRFFVATLEVPAGGVASGKAVLTRSRR